MKTYDACLAGKFASAAELGRYTKVEDFQKVRRGAAHAIILCDTVSFGIDPNVAQVASEALGLHKVVRGSGDVFSCDCKGYMKTQVITSKETLLIRTACTTQ